MEGMSEVLVLIEATARAKARAAEFERRATWLRETLGRDLSPMEIEAVSFGVFVATAKEAA